MTRLLIFATILVAGCAVTVNPESRKSVSLRNSPPAQGMATVFVGRECPITMPRHSVSINGSEREYLECMKFTRFDVPPGNSFAAFSSTENTAEIEFSADSGDVVYIKMDWSTGSGMGDVNVEPEIVDSEAGIEMISRMQAVE